MQRKSLFIFVIYCFFSLLYTNHMFTFDTSVSMTNFWLATHCPQIFLLLLSRVTTFTLYPTPLNHARTQLLFFFLLTFQSHLFFSLSQPQTSYPNILPRAWNLMSRQQSRGKNKKRQAISCCAFQCCFFSTRCHVVYLQCLYSSHRHVVKRFSHFQL